MVGQRTVFAQQAHDFLVAVANTDLASALLVLRFSISRSGKQAGRATDFRNSSVSVSGQLKLCLLYEATRLQHLAGLQLLMAAGCSVEDSMLRSIQPTRNDADPQIRSVDRCHMLCGGPCHLWRASLRACVCHGQCKVHQGLDAWLVMTFYWSTFCCLLLARAEAVRCTKGVICFPSRDALDF